MDSYENDLEASKTYNRNEDDWLSSKWTGFHGPKQISRIRQTGVDIDMLKKVGMQAGTVPDDFALHRQMAKIFKGRRDMAEAGTGTRCAITEYTAARRCATSSS